MAATIQSIRVFDDMPQPTVDQGGNLKENAVRVLSQVVVAAAAGGTFPAQAFGIGNLFQVIFSGANPAAGSYVAGTVGAGGVVLTSGTITFPATNGTYDFEVVGEMVVPAKGNVGTAAAGTLNG